MAREDPYHDVSGVIHDPTESIEHDPPRKDLLQHAAAGTIVESFETGTLDDYVGVSGESKAHFSNTNTFTPHGTRNLRWESAGDASTHRIESEENKDYYPIPGDTVEFQYKTTTLGNDGWCNVTFSLYLCWDYTTDAQGNQSYTFISYFHRMTKNSNSSNPGNLEIGLQAEVDGVRQVRTTAPTTTEASGDTFRVVWDTSESGMSAEVYQNGGATPYVSLSTGSHTVPYLPSLAWGNGSGCQVSQVIDMDYLRII